MNGKKKRLVVLGCSVLMAATIAGCSAQGSKSEKNQSASDKADSDSKSKGTVECVSEIEDRDFEQDEEVTIKKQVLVDQDGVVITAEEYICNQEDGEGILLSVANNTDKSIVFYEIEEKELAAFLAIDTKVVYVYYLKNQKVVDKK